MRDPEMPVVEFRGFREQTFPFFDRLVFRGEDGDHNGADNVFIARAQNHVPQFLRLGNRA